jgi:xanthine dehydrogenase accessory factor
VIVTRGHRDNLNVLRWAIERPAFYIGMIGLARKVLAVCQQLEAEGASNENLALIYAPIGPDIASVTPEEVAVSIIAELIAIRRHCSGVLSHARKRLRLEEDQPASTS